MAFAKERSALLLSLARSLLSRGFHRTGLGSGTNDRDRHVERMAAPATTESDASQFAPGSIIGMPVGENGTVVPLKAANSDAARPARPPFGLLPIGSEQILLPRRSQGSEDQIRQTPTLKNFG